MLSHQRTWVSSAILVLTLCATNAFALFTPEYFEDRHPPAMHGPFQLGLEYSDKLGFIIDPKYVNDLGPYNALSLEFAFGGSEFRAASTWGHALTERLFFKISAEYLAQQPTFFFATCEECEWLGQYGLGADLRYKIPCYCGIESFHIGFEYINAECETLDPKPFGSAQTNIRHLRGGRNYGGTIGLRVHPWCQGYIDLDLRYDCVTYDRIFESNKNNSCIGGSVAIHQAFGDNFQAVVSGTDRAAYYEYNLGGSWIAHKSQGSLFEILANFRVSGGDVASQTENRVGIGFHYSWGGNIHGPYHDYTSPLNRGAQQDLVDYTNVPAMRPPQVLVLRDQAII